MLSWPLAAVLQQRFAWDGLSRLLLHGTFKPRTQTTPLTKQSKSVFKEIKTLAEIAASAHSYWAQEIIISA
jgi:hypothetical protein